MPTPVPGRLAGKVALITGVARGQGRAHAVRLGLRDELGGDLPLVPLTQWVAKLETHAASPTKDDLEAIVRRLLPIPSRIAPY